MIDLAAVAEDYRERLRRERQAMVPLLIAIEAAVLELDRASRGLDQLTRDWPVLLHRDDALTVWVAVPKGAVPAGPDLGEAFTGAVRDTAAGGRLFTSALEQATGLRQVSSTLAEMAQAVLASVQAYQGPATSALFDPAGKTAGDLFGQAALVLRTALADPAIFRRAGRATADALRTLGVQLPLGGAPPGGGGQPLPELLADVVAAEMALILVLPRISALLGGLRAALEHEVRLALLGAFIGIERELYDLRRDVLRRLGLDPGIWEYLYAVDWVLRHNIVELVSWLPVAVREVLLWLHYTLQIVTRTGKSIAKWAQRILDAKDVLGDLAAGPIGYLIMRRYGALPGPDFSKIVLPPFPEPFATAFGPTAEKRIIDQLHAARDGADAAITRVFDSATKSMADAGAIVDQLGPTLARTSGFGPDAAEAASATTAVFGEELRRPPTGRQPFAALAVPLEQVLTGGGFELVGRLIPTFVATAGRLWRDLGAVPRPTSPHMLARHGRLAGVRVPDVTVVAAGTAPDDETARQVGDALRQAIVEAYVTGRRTFERLATEAGP